jgi:hypothetical protein
LKFGFFITVHSERSEESTHGCSASLSMTSDVIPSESEESSAWMLHCAQHDKVVDASLCFAPFSMTVHLAGE